MYPYPLKATSYPFYLEAFPGFWCPGRTYARYTVTTLKGCEDYYIIKGNLTIPEIKIVFCDGNKSS
jgi:hypothetical protein